MTQKIQLEMKKHGRKEHRLLAAGVLLAASIFFVDLSTPLGVAGGVPYVALVLLSLWSPRRRDTLVAGAVGTGLTILGFLFSPPGGEWMQVLDNRLLAVFAIWVTAIVGARRRTVEDEMRQTEAQLRLVTDDLPTMISYIDTEERFQLTNRAYEKWRGISREALKGVKVKDAIGEASYEGIREHMKEALAGQAVTFETEVSVPDKGRRFIHANYLPHYGERGQIKGFIATISDITEQKLAEQEIRKSNVELKQSVRDRSRELEVSEQRFETLASVSPVGIFQADAEGHYLYVNRRWCEITGLTPEQALGSSWAHALHPEDRERVVQESNHAQRLNMPYRSEYRIRRPDGMNTWVICESVNHTDRNGAILGRVGTITEITERKQAEQAMKAHLAQQATIAELGQLAMEGTDVTRLMEEVVNRVADTLGVEYCKVLELLPEGKGLLLRAGIGWKEGYVGRARVGTELDSQAGYTLVCKGPVIVEDLRTETRFSGPNLLHEHGVVSGLSVIISGEDKPYGVLGAHTQRQVTFTSGDANFLKSVAHLLAAALERSRKENALREGEERYRQLVELSPDAIVVHSDGKFVFANEASTRIYGVQNLEQLIGQPVLKFAPPEHQQAVSERIRTLYEARSKTPAWEMKVIGGDGIIRDVEGAGAPIFYQGKRAGQVVVRDITERKRADLALRESQANLAEAQRMAHVGSWEWDMVSNHLKWSDEIYRIFGLAPQASTATYEAFLERVHPDDRDSVNRKVDEAIRDKTPYLTEHRVVRPDGTERIASEKGEVFYDDSGKPIRMVGIIQDITEQKQADRALRESQANLAEAQRIAGLGNWIWDVSADIVHFSPELAHILGRTSEEMGSTYEGFIQYVHPEDRELLGKAVQEALEGKANYNTEFRVFLPDGSICVLNSQGEVRFDDSGKPTRMVGVAQNITERKNADLALRKSQASLAEAQRIAHVGSWEWDVPTNRQYWSDEVYRLLGLAPQAFPATFDAFLECVHPDDREPIKRRLDEAFKAERKFDMEYRVVHPDGSQRILHTQGEVSFDDSGKPTHIVGVAQDITERKRAEEALSQQAQELARYTEELERSNSDLEQFAYVASHDLQEPLRAVSSFSQLLAKRYKNTLGKDADDFIGFVVEGVVRMQALIQDLLTYSRVSTHGKSLEHTDVLEIVEGTIHSLRMGIQECDAEVNYKSLPTVLGDSGQLTQLFQNLISNALKFRSQARPRINISARQNGREWIFSVQDNGIGIDLRFADRIFVIFQRLHTREEYPGTGIGLALCKKIVERHGGRIWMESQPLKGTTFYFTLPLEESRA